MHRFLFPPSMACTRMSMRSASIALLVACTLAGLGPSVRAQDRAPTAKPAQTTPPHQHGTAHAGLTLDGADVLITLTIPLDSLLGYEGAPQTVNERRVADELLTWMRQGDLVFKLEASSPCSFIQAVVQAPVLDMALLRNIPGDSPGVAVPGARPDERPGRGSPNGSSGSSASSTGKGPTHHDLKVDYVFACATPEPPHAIRTMLFSSFKRLERMEMQAGMPHGVVKGTLRRGADTLSLSRTEPKKARGRKEAA